MNCLNCNEEMINNLVQTKKEQIAYDICEACGSLWLDAGELDKMAFQVAGSIEYCSRDAAEGVAGRKKECPRCDQTILDKVYFIGCEEIVLDHCRNCGGFWLDGGELDLINRELEDIMPVQGKGFSEFVNNVHLPYWHKRVRAKSSETDFKIDVSPIKGARLESETQHKCPACNSKLNAYSLYKIVVDGCPECKGVFLDQGELRKLKDMGQKGSWQDLRWMDDELDAVENSNAMPSRRVCPKCDPEGKANLIAACFGDSKIIIDWCPKCHGIWLDRDELSRIIQCLRDKLMDLSSEEARAKVVEEIKEILGGPEGTLSEILDAKAAISALINITIFEHPTLCNMLIAFGDSTPIR
jgi:Zn-finger nucleic acid-binding protein